MKFVSRMKEESEILNFNDLTFHFYVSLPVSLLARWKYEKDQPCSLLLISGNPVNSDNKNGGPWSLYNSLHFWKLFSLKFPFSKKLKTHTNFGNFFIFSLFFCRKIESTTISTRLDFKLLQVGLNQKTVV